MKRLVVVLAVLGLWSGAAVAAPGDPRVVQGTLEWPSRLAAEPFVVVRADDGRLYYADVSAAQRRSLAAISAGSRVTVLGVEGGRPHELAAIALGAGDAAALRLAVPSAAPVASGFFTPTAEDSSEPMWRLDGIVQSVSGTLVTVRIDNGSTQTVDVSQLSEGTRRTLRPGERMTLFGVPRGDRKLVANGYIQTEPATPAASPPSTR
jgi:hypothetical protein